MLSMDLGLVVKMCLLSFCHRIALSSCELFQEPSSKCLNCQAKSKSIDIGAGYGTLGDNLKSFFQLGSRPLPFDIDSLDEGDGIGSTLDRNHPQMAHIMSLEMFIQSSCTSYNK